MEVIHPSQMDNAADLPKAPNIAVDGELLGPAITYKELEESVMEKLSSQKMAKEAVNLRRQAGQSPAKGPVGE